MSDAPALYLEDLTPGMRFACPSWTVEADDIVRFAREFDPQPFHLDAAQAAETFFGGMVASGWHTAAMMMGMATRSAEFQPANGHVGMGVDGLRFHRPVRPGDVLHMEIEIVSTRRSATHPGFGVAKVRWHARDGGGEAVAEATPSMWIATRTATA